MKFPEKQIAFAPFKPIYFDFDKSSIRDDAKAVVTRKDLIDVNNREVLKRESGLK
jgi:hypothetical protein